MKNQIFKIHSIVTCKGHQFYPVTPKDAKQLKTGDEIYQELRCGFLNKFIVAAKPKKVSKANAAVYGKDAVKIEIDSTTYGPRFVGSNLERTIYVKRFSEL